MISYILRIVMNSVLICNFPTKSLIPPRRRALLLEIPHPSMLRRYGLYCHIVC